MDTTTTDTYTAFCSVWARIGRCFQIKEHMVGQLRAQLEAMR